MVFFVLRNVRGGSETYMLVLECSADLPVEEEVRRALASYQTKVRSKVVRNNRAELTVEVLMKDDNMNVVNVISQIEGVDNVTMVQYRGSYDA